MEEKEQSVATQTEVNDGTDYIEALKEMRQKSVAREDYEKLKGENKKLLSVLVNGEKLDVPNKQAERPDINNLRRKLFNTEETLTNLEYCKAALELRTALMDAGEVDPFLPSGTRVEITSDMIEKSNRVAQIYQECIDIADGDSGVFTAELQRRTRDVAIPGLKR